jgi:hypothetical protein
MVREVWFYALQTERVLNAQLIEGESEFPNSYKSLSTNIPVFKYAPCSINLSLKKGCQDLLFRNDSA